MKKSPDFFAKANLFVVLTHLIGWVLFLSLPVLFLTGNNDSVDFKAFLFSVPYWVYIGLYAFIFYFHNHILLPRLYFGKSRFLYFLALVIMGAGVLMIQPFDKVMRITRPGTDFSNPKPMPAVHPPQPPMPYFPSNPDDKHSRPKPPPDAGDRPFPGNDFFARPFVMHVDIISLFLYLLLIAMGVLIDGAKKLQNVQRQLLKSESEKSRAELTFLKAQINPHFIFNTLNNLYSLAEVKSKETPEAILKLSGIMRYIIDNMDDMWVPLKDEITCINDYIYLQQLRLGKPSELKYSVNGNFEGKRIAPLILISFIENVFKYGISKHELSPLTISITMQGNDLVFITENKIFRDGNSEGKGLGITNTRKRLDLMYPGKYRFDIDNAGNLFKVKLILELHSL